MQTSFLLTIISVLSLILYAVIKCSFRKNFLNLEAKFNRFPKDKRFEEILQDLLKKKGRYSEEDVAKAKSDNEEIIEFSKKHLRESQENFAKYVIWISGGAFTIATTIFASDRFQFLESGIWFDLTLVFFGLGLCAAILNYVYRSHSHAKLLEMYKNSDQIKSVFDDIKFLNENDSLSDEAIQHCKEKMESYWSKIRLANKEGRRFDLISVILARISLCFIVTGILAFLIFAIRNTKL